MITSAPERFAEHMEGLRSLRERHGAHPRNVHGLDRRVLREADQGTGLLRREGKPAGHPAIELRFAHEIPDLGQLPALIALAKQKFDGTVLLGVRAAGRGD